MTNNENTIQFRIVKNGEAFPTVLPCGVLHHAEPPGRAGSLRSHPLSPTIAHVRAGRCEPANPYPTSVSPTVEPAFEPAQIQLGVFTPIGTP